MSSLTQNFSLLPLRSVKVSKSLDELQRSAGRNYRAEKSQIFYNTSNVQLTRKGIRALNCNCILCFFVGTKAREDLQPGVLACTSFIAFHLTKFYNYQPSRQTFKFLEISNF